MSEPSRDQPAFTVTSLTSLVIASMVGAGVFTTSGYTLSSVKTPGAVLLCWVIGGLIAVCGAIAYGALARQHPISGGEYTFLHRRVHPFAGFLAGWVSLSVGFSGAIAMTALLFVEYAFPDSLRPTGWGADGIAIALIIACAIVTDSRRKSGRRFVTAIVVLKLLGLCLLLAVIVFQAPGLLRQFTAQPWIDSSVQLSDYAISVMWISLSYAGFNAAIYVSGETQTPKRDVRMSLIAGTLAVFALYLLLNFVFVSAGPAEVIAGRADVAAAAAERLVGTRGTLIVRLIVSLALVSSVAGMIVTGPRVYARMADDGTFPAFFRSQKGLQNSIWLQVVLAVAVIVAERCLTMSGNQSNSIEGLLNDMSITLSLSSAICVISLLRPMSTDEKIGWGTRAAAVMFAFATLATIALRCGIAAEQIDWQPMIRSLAILAMGAVFWTIAMFLRPNKKIRS